MGQRMVATTACLIKQIALYRYNIITLIMSSLAISDSVLEEIKALNGRIQDRTKHYSTLRELADKICEFVLEHEEEFLTQHFQKEVKK